MQCQSLMPSEGAAPTHCAAFNLLPSRESRSGSSDHLATRDQPEVGTLSGGAKLDPLSEPLQPDIRLIRPPLPPSSTASLAVSLPQIQQDPGQ